MSHPILRLSSSKGLSVLNPYAHVIMPIYQRTGYLLYGRFSEEKGDTYKNNNRINQLPLYIEKIN